MKKELIILLLLISCTVPAEPKLPGPDSCSPDVVCKQLVPNTLTIGSFNIQTFGRAKRNKTEVMNVIKDIVEDFDLVAIQEIRDSSLETSGALLKMLNSSRYGVIVSPRLGRTSSKEQYAFYYDKKFLTFHQSFVFNDTQDLFERPPFTAVFTINGTEFAFVDVHIKPEDAESEISHLSDVLDTISTENILVLGDFNADGSYLDEKSKPAVAGLAYYIPDSYDTTVGKAFYTYDRILGNVKILQSGVYKFDDIHKLSYEEAKAVSDHYPVYVLLNAKLLS
ncbi:endonuclease/exonuclease/phosphatase family protein [Candidatus Woesearchaeota archaeon]|nr:endonuclease/exonuclease/phosphatase family protein [Candidatus Woesearchaeota archaeon]